MIEAAGLVVMTSEEFGRLIRQTIDVGRMLGASLGPREDDWQPVRPERHLHSV